MIFTAVDDPFNTCLMSAESAFRPVQAADGYLPIEDYGLIGDGETAALVGRDGAITWMCVPQFDSPPLFCGLLDRERGGHFVIAVDELQEARQHYLGDTAVLVTELRSASGVLRVTDAMTLHEGADLTEDARHARGELLRMIEVLDGEVHVRIDLRAHGGQDLEQRRGRHLIRWRKRSELGLCLHHDLPFSELPSSVSMRAGDSGSLFLRWDGVHQRRPKRSARDALRNTVRAWEGWSQRMRYEGPQASAVRRSAITLKMLDHFENGAIIAAPTSSLPERMGGTRNWDYRYAWIRDASFSTYALDRIGLHGEASDFLGWVLDLVDRDGHPSILYTPDGTPPPAEQHDEALRGYRNSAPVRWGNAAANQRQNDVFGELLDCAYLWVKRGGTLDERLWGRLCRLVEDARQRWDQPDQGIWEVRSAARPFTYSAALCHVAIDRGARLLESHHMPGPDADWRADAETIRAAIIDRAWDEEQQSFTEHLGYGRLDASLLALPLRRVVDAMHPRMMATTAAIAQRLDAGKGLLYRYLPVESPDGLPGGEGAFLLCSFWLVDNLAQQGRLQAAHDLFDSLCARANPLGLLPEQIDPRDGSFLGNFPQALSHVGLITSAVGLNYQHGKRGEPRRAR